MIFKSYFGSSLNKFSNFNYETAKSLFKLSINLTFTTARIKGEKK